MRKKTLVLCAAVLVHAAGSWGAITGTAVAVQGASWMFGKIVLVDLPGKQTKVLYGGSGTGPCFSPDGREVAFFREVKSGSSTTGLQLYRIPVSGSTGDTVNTGIFLPYDQTGCVWVDGPSPGTKNSCVYWLDLNGSAGSGEYFYWLFYAPAGSVPSGWMRAKVGSSTIESVFEIDTMNGTKTGCPDGLRNGGYWGGVSKDGTRATATTMGFSGFGIDIGAKSMFRLFGSCGLVSNPKAAACNTAISPDGRKAMSNYRTHEGVIISDFASRACVEYIAYDNCGGDLNRWSHHNDSIITWSDCNGGTVYHLFTKERLVVGSAIYDVHPDRLLNAAPQVATPVISPNSGIKPAGQLAVTITSATAGAQIRYTTNGTDPSATGGAPLANGGTLNLQIDTAATITLKAVAYVAAGMDPSIVQIAEYRGPLRVNPITVISPAGGEQYRIGDTLTLKFTADTLNYAAFEVAVSLDNGRSWENINTETIQTSTKGWDTYAWEIPPTLNGVLCVSSAALVRVAPYNNPDMGAVSKGTFSITANSATESRLRQHGSYGKIVTVQQGDRLLVCGLDPRIGSVALVTPLGRTVTPLQAVGRGAWQTPRARVAPGSYVVSASGLSLTTLVVH